MIDCPVIHVSGDEPELVLKAASIAVEYQRRYNKLVEFLCTFLEQLYRSSVVIMHWSSEIYKHSRSHGVISYPYAIM